MLARSGTLGYGVRNLISGFTYLAESRCRCHKGLCLAYSCYTVPYKEPGFDSLGFLSLIIPFSPRQRHDTSWLGNPGKTEEELARNTVPQNPLSLIISSYGSFSSYLIINLIYCAFFASSSSFHGCLMVKHQISRWSQMVTMTSI